MKILMYLEKSCLDLGDEKMMPLAFTIIDCLKTDEKH